MDIITKVTKDAERLLKSLRAKYYIELPTGEQIWHDLDGYELVPQAEEEKPERKKRETRTGLPFGALSAHYKPILDNCKKPGDIAMIPFMDGVEAEHLRGAIAAYCCTNWGKGTYTSVMNRKSGHVEVMRTAVSTPAAKTTAASKVNGNGKAREKFHTVGHGLESLQNLHFTAYDDQPK